MVWFTRSPVFARSVYKLQDMKNDGRRKFRESDFFQRLDSRSGAISFGSLNPRLLTSSRVAVVLKC